MDDDLFLAAFEAGTIPRIQWTHAAHVRMARLYLGRFPFAVALQRIRDGIRRYNAAVGGPPTAYHETITVAFTLLIHDRMRRGPPDEDFQAFADRCPDLLDRTLSSLHRHYARETLASGDARERFVEPDRDPLPGA